MAKRPVPVLAGLVSFDARPVPVLRRFYGKLLLFHHALQRMLVLARKIHHLRDLGLRDLIGKNATLPDSMMMNVQHDLGRRLDVLLEKLLQHVNDKLHRRVIVVQYQYAVEIRAFRLWLDFGDDGCGGATWSAGAALVV